jgi:hypothetical protein
MSRLKDLVSKGVRLIVTDPEADSAQTTAPDAPPATAGNPRELGAEVLDVALPRPIERSALAADLDDFGAVYEEAGIELPLHGYGVFKVGEMLENKRLATLTREVKASAVFAALEAASVSIQDVVQDAVVRDKALDAFEAVKQQELHELRQKSDTRIAAIRDEIEKVLREKNAEIEGLKQAVETASAAFLKLQELKHREEERLHTIVSHFVEGAANPVSMQRGAAAPSKPESA